MKKIRPLSHLHTTVTVPGSKSITHRAIIAASLAAGESILQNYLECEDTLHTISALRELGVSSSREGKTLKVKGTGGRFRRAGIRKEIYVGNSGTSLRLLSTVFALSRGEFLLTGAPRLLKRPIGPLVTALRQVGVEAKCVNHDGCPPVLIKAAGICGGKLCIPGDQSSQFISSLLLSGPYSENDIEVKVIGKLVSAPYVDITIAVMEHFGITVDRESYRYFRIPSQQQYQSRKLTIQGDVSTASYFWAAAAVTGGTVTTVNIDPYTTTQGDIRFLEILERMGCSVERNSGRIVVRGGILFGVEADMGSMPDMVPTLAAIAPFALGKTSIQNVRHVRFKESDRLNTIRHEWGRLGSQVEETEEGLIIHGEAELSGAIMDPHNDHRLAMSLAVIGLRVPGIIIKNESCVNKSFPQFWELWDHLQGNKVP